MTAAEESRARPSPRRVPRPRAGDPARAGNRARADSAGRLSRRRRSPSEAPVPAKPDASALLGVAWAILTAVMLFAGSVLMAMWMAVVAALAAVQAARSWKHHASRHPAPLAAGTGAAVVVLGAGFGIPGIAVGALAGVAAAAAWASQESADVALTVACVVVPALAAVPPVLLRSTDGLVPAFVLLTCVGVYDAGAHVMGTGSRWRWLGPVSGMLCIASVTLAVAALFPQFKGASPLELGVLAAVLAPCGPLVADRIVGTNTARRPALRRLDSLIVVGPVWALAAAMLVK